MPLMHVASFGKPPTSVWVPAGTVTNAATSGTTTFAGLAGLASDGTNIWLNDAPSSFEAIAKIAAGVGTQYASVNDLTSPTIVYASGGPYLFFGSEASGTAQCYLVRVGTGAPTTRTTAQPSGTGTQYTPQCIGPDGFLWFLYDNTGLGRVLPSTMASYTSYPASGTGLTGGRTSLFCAVDGGDGYLYVVSTNASNAFLDRIGTGTSGTTLGAWSNIATIATSSTVSPGSIAHPLALGPDGNWWATARITEKIYKVTPGGVSTAYTTPNAGTKRPGSICVGGDGALWYVESNGTHLVRVPTTVTGTSDMTAYVVSTAVPVTDILPGFDNASLYLAANGDSKVYKFV